MDALPPPALDVVWDFLGNLWALSVISQVSTRWCWMTYAARWRACDTHGRSMVGWKVLVAKLRLFQMMKVAHRYRLGLVND